MTSKHSASQWVCLCVPTFTTSKANGKFITVLDFSSFTFRLSCLFCFTRSRRWPRVCVVEWGKRVSTKKIWFSFLFEWWVRITLTHAAAGLQNAWPHVTLAYTDTSHCNRNTFSYLVACFSFSYFFSRCKHCQRLSFSHLHIHHRGCGAQRMRLSYRTICMHTKQITN